MFNALYCTLVGPKSVSLDLNAPEIKLADSLLRYSQELDRLILEENSQILCYIEPSDKLNEKKLRICLLLFFFLACFALRHYNKMGGHTAASKAYANAKRFHFWPGVFDWICVSTADCLAFQNKKRKPKHLNGVPMEKWQ